MTSSGPHDRSVGGAWLCEMLAAAAEIGMNRQGLLRAGYLNSCERVNAKGKININKTAVSRLLNGARRVHYILCVYIIFGGLFFYYYNYYASHHRDAVLYYNIIYYGRRSTRRHRSAKRNHRRVLDNKSKSRNPSERFLINRIL